MISTYQELLIKIYVVPLNYYTIFSAHDWLDLDRIQVKSCDHFFIKNFLLNIIEKVFKISRSSTFLSSYIKTFLLSTSTLKNINNFPISSHLHRVRPLCTPSKCKKLDGLKNHFEICAIEVNAEIVWLTGFALFGVIRS